MACHPETTSLSFTIFSTTESPDPPLGRNLANGASAVSHHITRVLDLDRTRFAGLVAPWACEPCPLHAPIGRPATHSRYPANMPSPGPQQLRRLWAAAFQAGATPASRAEVEATARRHGPLASRRHDPGSGPLDLPQRTDGRWDHDRDQESLAENPSDHQPLPASQTQVDSRHHLAPRG